MDWFEESLLKARKLLKGYAMYLYKNPDDAEDAVQGACLKAWAARDRFKPEGEGGFDAWLLTILKNDWKSARRRIARHRIDFTDNPNYADHLQAPDNPETRMIVAEQLDAVSRVGKQKDVLILLGIGMKVREVAEACGIPENTVKSRMSRGREKLLWATEGGLC